jgi:hypothetical protein
MPAFAGMTGGRGVVDLEVCGLVLDCRVAALLAMTGVMGRGFVGRPGGWWCGLGGGLNPREGGGSTQPVFVVSVVAGLEDGLLRALRSQ